MRSARQTDPEPRRHSELLQGNGSRTSLLTDRNDDLNVLRGHLLGVTGELRTWKVHGDLTRKRHGPEFGIGKLLVKSLDFLSQAVKRKRETWDADELFHDMWRQTLRHMDALDQVLGAAAPG